MTPPGVRAGRAALWSGVLLAAPPVAGATGTPLPGYTGQLLSGLAFVVAVILLLGWVLRRLPGGNARADRAIDILAVRAVGARERIVLIQVGTEQLLLGVAPAGIHCLHRLRVPVAITPAPPAPSERAFTSFARVLQRQLGDRHAS